MEDVLIRYGMEEFVRGTVLRKIPVNMKDVPTMLLREEFASGMVLW